MLSIQVNNKCEECAHHNICKWEDIFVRNLETISASVEEIPPSPLILSASCERFMKNPITIRRVNDFSDSFATITDSTITDHEGQINGNI